MPNAKPATVLFAQILLLLEGAVMLGLGWSHHGHKFKNVNNALSPSFSTVAGVLRYVTRVRLFCRLRLSAN